MGETWRMTGKHWSADPVEGAWWEAVTASFQHELAGLRPVGMRVEIGSLGDIALHDLDEREPLSMRRIDQLWSSHRWSRLGASDRPVLLNEDMPYRNLGAPVLHLALGLGPEAAAADSAGEQDTAPVQFEWGTGAISPVSSVSRSSAQVLEARIEAACMELDAAESATEAAAITLSALRRFIEVERGAVLVASGDPGIFDIACIRGVETLNRYRHVAPRDRGLGRFVSATGMAVMVNAPGAPPVFRPAEISTGEATQSVFCIPLVDLKSGLMKGIIELSRPAVRFQHWQLEIGIALGAALSEALVRLGSQSRRSSWAG